MTLWDKLEDIRKNLGVEIYVKLYYRNIPLTDYTSLAEFIMNISNFILDMDESKYDIIPNVLGKYFIIKIKKEVFE